MDRLLRVGLGVVLALSPLIILPGGYDPANLPQGLFIRCAALLLLALWCLRARGQGRVALDALPFAAPLVALLAWSALSLLWARNRYEGASVWTHWAACALVGWLVADTVRNAGQAKDLLKGLFVAGVLVALLGLLQHLFGVQWVPQAFPPAATFVNRNMAAQFAVMVLPLGIAFAVESGGALAACAWAAGSAVIGAFVFHTLTRSAWLALAVEAALALWWTWPRSRSLRPSPRLLPAGVAAVVLVALACAGPAGSTSGLHAAYERLGVPWLRTPGSSEAPPAAVASVQGRLAIWRNTLAMVGDVPIRGLGLGSHAVYYPLYSRRVVRDPQWSPQRQLDYAHNDYLQAWAELGTVGLALLLWLGLSILRLLRSLPQPPGPFPLALVAGLAGIGIDGLFSFPFHRAVPPLVAAVFLGLVAVLARENADAPAARDWAAFPPRVALPAIAASLIALAATAYLGFHVLRGDRHCLRMFQAQARGDGAAVFAEGEAARRDDPWRSEPPFVMASAAIASGDPQRAASLLQEVVGRLPWDFGSLANLGLASIGTRDYVKALEYHRRALALAPEEAILHFRTATLLESFSDLPGALEEYRQAAHHAPTNATYAFREGAAAIQQGAYGQAEEALGRAIALNPGSAPAHKALGVLLVDVLGRRDEGLPHLRKALELDPGIKDHERMQKIVDASR